MSLRERLSDWTDWDSASYILGCELDIFTGDEEWLSVKGVFWGSNKLGEGLADTLRALVRAGVLEHRTEPDDQYRWAMTGGPFDLVADSVAAE